MFTELYRAITSAIYNPAFYSRVIRAPLSKPIRLTALLGFIGAAITMIFLYAIAVPFAFSNTLDKVAAAFPDDLVVTVAHGAMSINQPQPYEIKNTLLPVGLKDLVIFDGDDTLKGDANSNSTFVLVKKTYLMTASATGTEDKVTSFDPTLGTTTIGKSDVIGMVDAVRPYWKPVILVGGLFGVVLGAIIVALVWLGSHLVYAVIPATLIYLFTRFNHPQILWSQTYIIALYASMPIVILHFLVLRFGLQPPIFLYTLLVVLIAIPNFAGEAYRTPHLSDPE